MRTALAWIAALVLAGVAPAWAHDQSTFSHVKVVLRSGGADVRLSVHRRDAAAVLGLATPDSLPAGSTRQADAAAPRPAGTASRGARRRALHAISWNGAALDPERREVELSGDVSWARPPGRLAVSARLFPDNPLHETFVDVYDRGRLLRQAVLTDTQPAFDTFTAGPAGLWAVFVTFVRAGVHHIFIGPDHILFVIGLLLLGGSLGRILKIIAGFTLAHSIKLGQAAIVLAAAPLLAVLRSRSPRLAPRAMALASCGVVLAGGWWFVERVWLGG